jgi:putative SOS response-associated peptidase YedK
MCGRFTLTAPDELVAEVFDLEETPRLSPRFNIAPAQAVAVVRRDRTGASRLEMAQWGFPARGASATDEAAPPALLINARSETAASKPSFREAFAGRRCLIPADGFYEWKKGRREAFHYQLREAPLFAFAGLWEPAPDARAACVILTTDANELVGRVHGRMPVILPRSAYARWLDPRPEDLKRLGELLRPYPAEGMAARAVCPFVNDARHEGPRCLEPPRQASLFGE